MKRLIFFSCFALFSQISEIWAMDIEKDSVLFYSIKTQIFSDDAIINSFCYNKKLTIYKGIQEDCLLTNRYLKSIFFNLTVNNQRMNFQKLVYCVKDGSVKINDDSFKLPGSIQKLDYYIVTFEKNDAFISQYISNLKYDLYKIVIPATKAPYICYLFMKENALIILSHRLKITLSDDMEINREEKFDMEKLIEMVSK